MNVETIITFLTTQGADFGLKILGALAAWIVGRWLIGLVLRAVGAALERGKQEYKLTDGDLADVIGRAVDTFRYRAEQDALAITVTGATGPLPAKFDDQAVMLALLNLLDNAAKYGNNTAMVLDVRTLPDRIELSVRDHGPGIPKEDLKKIFDRFYRSRGKESARGSGIGLALVKHIAEAHGGRAWARNVDDGGAVVAFSISLAKVSA